MNSHFTNTRHFSFSDRFCLGVDQALRAVFNNPKTTGRPYPVDDMEEPNLTIAERQHSSGLMRVNHTGEVCAQALYHGQSITSYGHAMKEKMHQAAIEEGDHLAWCHRRILELDSHTSYLNFLWYLGSFAMGLTAGFIGDSWSLGFVAETETQVIQHLEKHLMLLPLQDKKSYAILKKMQSDEEQHKNHARDAGAKTLPRPIKKLMGVLSAIMVKTAYWM
ncbi:MAG: coq7 [Gammaproteobacteria bacterium]|nr:coq7 [Gammaproteobacteria bacterium]